VYITISDDGPGIPEPWRERVFESFVRRDETSPGAGVGLFAARHLARAMGGDLRLEDRPADGGRPAGSKFVLELVAAHGPAPRKRSTT
jgi:signal transduction histidine kinase